MWLLIGGCLLMAFVGVLRGPSWIFFVTAGWVSGLGVDSIARLHRWPEGLTDHLWVVPLVFLLLFFFLGYPEAALASFVAFVVIRIGIYVRINERYPAETTARGHK
jgi:hypothetical protein